MQHDVTGDGVTETVRRQYEAYSYPGPLDDISKEGLAADPSAAEVQLWPAGKPRENLRILSAGCGTNQAAMLAFRNRNCSVLGIDLSESSLAHEARLRERHSLDNLALKRMSLLDIESLHQEFDYIVCTGVLHHLADPDAGLRTLANVLAPEGRMYLMLYAAAGRAGVYLLQDLLRRMGLNQSPEDIALARATLKYTPTHHYIANFQRYAGGELDTDAGFVDVFLHSQDRAYSIPEIMTLLDRANLSFAGWLDNGDYYPDRFFKSGEVLARIQSLPELEQFAIVENLTLSQIKHDFFACKRSQQPLTSFEDEAWLSFVPHLQFTRTASGANAATWKITTRGLTTPLSPIEAFVVSQIDGKRNISDIVNHQTLANYPDPLRLQFAREFFSRMWRLGHLVYAR